MTGLEAAGQTQYYQNNAFGISFNINDNLTLSYGEMDSTRHITNATGNNKRTMTAESIQLSYTMGGATIAIAENSVDNASYGSTSTFDSDGTTLALTLAF